MVLVDSCSAGKLSQAPGLPSENQRSFLAEAAKDIRFRTNKDTGVDFCGWTAGGEFWTAETKIGRIRGSHDGRLITLPLDSGLADAAALLDGEVPLVHIAGHGQIPEAIYVSSSGVLVQELLDAVAEREPAARPFAAAIRPAREGRAFRAARDALEGFLSGMDRVVDEFITTWLGRKPDGCHEAVTTALLEEWPEGLDIADDEAVLRDFKARVARATRNLKPLWELQANYGPIQCLDEPLTPAGDTLGDLLAGGTDTETEALDNIEYLDSHRCLASILSLTQLSPTEEHVVNELSRQNRPVKWQKLATELGYSREFGRRIKRRLQYYAEVHVDRMRKIVPDHDCCRQPYNSIEAISPRAAW
ncbi:hypothetical protein [Streptomyces sp. NBC_00568]|uniref:hypothetical protein n=1 Tax=Streptomyces sp. NBC_00568 TaxID=2975779 RepID=UPI002250B08D|nr:hypothetical protein [Streptomyces sp. NBC_00568]MCX4993493.1 hypothetical protein [Streptomyces sp. NBC_00568]